ncbi:MAG: acyl-CoA thioesterase [Lentisphaerae bacterium]|nr:acyl-CoA thioesterase [Lentisphaerota bacterium]
METFAIRRLVEFADTDMAGVVHFTAYFRFMEAAEHAFLRSRGITLIDSQRPGLVWPRVKCGFEYRAPLRFDDEFEVQLSLVAVGRASLTVRAEIIRDGQVLAVGHSVNACCRQSRTGKLKAVPIPTAVRKQLESATPPARGNRNSKQARRGA